MFYKYNIFSTSFKGIVNKIIHAVLVNAMQAFVPIFGQYSKNDYKSQV